MASANILKETQRTLGLRDVQNFSTFIDELIDLARKNEQLPNVYHLSEYVGAHMLNPLLAAALNRYLRLIGSGEMHAGHGYDENTLVEVVKEKIKTLIGFKEFTFSITGTGANLILLSSIVSAYFPDSDTVQFVACDTEHTVALEGDMLRKTGIRQKNYKLFPSRNEGDGLITPRELEDFLKRENIQDRNFIFQMAIPTNMGVVPSLEELNELVVIVKNHGGKFLIDGARLTNALVYWNINLQKLQELGVDGLTLGTSKKGGITEVVGVFDENAAKTLLQEAKAFGHIYSKMTPHAFVTAAFLCTNFWEKEALSENKSAALFAKYMNALDIPVEYKVCTNMVFIKISEDVFSTLRKSPTFGEIYKDYGPNKDIGRIIFSGFESHEKILAAAKALAQAMGKDPLILDSISFI